MVCPNCNSDQVIQVQDQHFCINCGQMVPELSAHPVKSHTKVQSNGLPEGVTILPLGDNTSLPAPDVASFAVEPNKVPAAVMQNATDSIIHTRPRLGTASDQPPAVKRRKPGRPKAGRLDVPRTITTATAAVVLPNAPQIRPAAATAPAAVTGPRSMSDIAPRRSTSLAAPAQVSGTSAAAERRSEAHTAPPLRRHARAHRVGVPALHYGPIIAFSFRARIRPRLVGLAALGAASFGTAAGYVIWKMLNDGPLVTVTTILQSGPKLAAEAVLLAMLYYIGRSIGQTAIIYGIAREADQRPATLSRQFGVAINTFGRRLLLDLMFAVAELVLLGAGIILFFSGGASWQVSTSLQIGLVFGSYMVLLYLLSALALSRGLAGVNLTLTSHTAKTAAKLGWTLFSHRFELIGPRFGAALMEAVLAVPLVAIGVVISVSAPAQYYSVVAIAAGLLAWLAGALLGVGTAAWWSMLYRQLVLTDRPGAAVALLSSRQPEEARRTPLILIVALSTLIISVAIALPWVRLT